MTLTPHDQKVILNTIASGDTLIMIVGRKGEEPNSRKQAVMMMGDGNLLARDMQGALNGTENLALVVNAATNAIVNESKTPSTERIFHLMDGNRRIPITEQGAVIIWGAYIEMNKGEGQSIERREARGGIAHLEEIELWKEKGFLPKDFDWRNYEVKE